jgi:hypothetical protein
MPAVSTRSLAPQGIRAAARGSVRRAISASAFRACASARSRVSVMVAVDLRLEALEPVEVDARQPLRASGRATGSSARDRGGRRRRCLRPSRQRRGGAGVRTNRSRAGPTTTPGRAGFQRLAGARVGSSATLRGPCAVRRAAPWTRASCRGLRALRGRELDLYELLGLRDGGRRDLRSHGRAGAESRRHARGRGRGRRRRLRIGARDGRGSQGGAGQAQGGALQERASWRAHGKDCDRSRDGLSSAILLVWLMA